MSTVAVWRQQMIIIAARVFGAAASLKRLGPDPAAAVAANTASASCTPAARRQLLGFGNRLSRFFLAGCESGKSAAFCEAARPKRAKRGFTVTYCVL